MNFGSMTQLQVKEIIEINNQGNLKNALKVFDPENSTVAYNLHTLLRKGSNGCYVIAEKPYYDNGRCHDMTIVLAVTKGGQYVTWVYSSGTQFNHGNYYSGDYTKAFQNFLERGSYSFKVDADVLDFDNNEEENDHGDN